MKLLKHEDRQAALKDIFSSENELTKELEAVKQWSMPMTWDNLREMHNEGMSIGSHTVTHPILSTINHDELKHELTFSKQRIEEEIGCAVDSIAYPVGQQESTTDTVETETHNAGYKVAFSYIDGINSKNRYSISRVHVDYNMPLSYFKSKLVLPEVFCD